MKLSILFLVILMCLFGGWAGHQAGWKSGQRQASRALLEIDPAARQEASVLPTERKSSPNGRLAVEQLSEAVRIAASSAEDGKTWLAAFERLAAVSPRSAWELLSQIDLSDRDVVHGYYTVLKHWIEASPVEAWKALLSLPDEHQHQLAEGLDKPLHLWATQDLDGAFGAWAKLPEAMRRQAFSGIGRLASDAATRPPLLIKLREVADEEIRLSAYLGTAEAWAYHGSIKDVGLWLDGEDSFSEEQRAELERKTAYVAVLHNPKQAVDWLLARSTPERRSADLEAIVAQWGSGSPNACAEWLGTLTFGHDTDAAVSTFAQRISYEDPESAVGWTQRIVDEDQRQHTLIQVMGDWSMREPTAARAFYESDALDESEQATLRRFMR